MPLRSGFNKETQNRIQENIKKLSNNGSHIIVLFRREYFKMQDCINWDDNKDKYCLSTRLIQHLQNKIYTVNKAVLLGSDLLNTKTLDKLLSVVNDINVNKYINEKKSSLMIAVKRRDLDNNDYFLVFYTMLNSEFKFVFTVSLLANDYYLY